MPVVDLAITSRMPYEGGRPFGEVGPYEQLEGVLSFAIDPAGQANAAIHDLAKAADVDGIVRFRSEFSLLQPEDPERGKRRLLFDVLNRGRRVALQMFNQTPYSPLPTARLDPGDGFLFRHGWTVAWCAWQWDVARQPGLLLMEAPQIRENGVPVPGQASCQFQPDEHQPSHLLANRNHLPLPTADLNDPDAVLTVRDWLDGTPTIIPRERWQFAHDNNGAPVPDENFIWLDGGFTAGKVYEVVFTTRICPLVGAGLLAVRDCVSFLRGSTDVNPAAGRIDFAYGFGMSQSGRFLRHLLRLGMNLDVDGCQVFDGILSHVAGARIGEFNQRYGQPGFQSARTMGSLPPFADTELTDPSTGITDSLLRRQRELGGVPKIITTNTSAEYWRGDGSLLHADLAGAHDVEPSGGHAIYLFGGTHHLVGKVPLSDTSELDGARGSYAFNVIDYRPLLRAALVNLADWVEQEEAPPASQFPRLADGTAVSPQSVIARFVQMGIRPLDPAMLTTMQRLDFGPQAEHGIVRYPAGRGEPFPFYVSAVDEEGNEIAGVLMPDVRYPVATMTGWNPRHPTTGGTGQRVEMYGSTIPFPASTGERAEGDTRRPLAERYPSRGAYLDRIRGAAEALVAKRMLLAEDVDLCVKLAAERYDALASVAQLV